MEQHGSWSPEQLDLLERGADMQVDTTWRVIYTLYRALHVSQLNRALFKRQFAEALFPGRKHNI